MSIENQDDVETLRGDIEETRHRISGEIEAIGDKLTPEHAKSVARDKVVEARDRTIENVKSRAREAAGAVSHAAERLPSFVRENPVPVAMLIVGGAWLGASMLRARREPEPQLELEIEPAPHATSRARARLESATAAARERVGAAAQSARHRISDTAHVVKDRAGVYAEKGRHGAVQVRDRSSEAFEHNPLAFGAACVLGGLALGLVLPHTRPEDRILGRRREQMMGRARHLAEEATEVAIESAKEGIRAAKETAKHEARARDVGI